MKEFRLPDPGEGLVEAEIVRWLVHEGDTVKVNDILLEIETSKSIVELPSPFAGRVARLMVDEGTTVDVGTPIILIDDGTSVQPAAEESPTPDEGAAPKGTTAPDGTAAPEEVAQPSEPVDAEPVDAEPAEPEDADAEATAAAETDAMLVGYGVKAGSLVRRPRKGVAAFQTGPQADQVHESYAASQPVSRRVDEPTTTPRSTAQPTGEPLPRPGQAPKPVGESNRSLAKPPVRRLARDLGLDLDELSGTGPAGTITADDVLDAAQAARGAAPAAQAGAEPETRVRLRGVRREMARTMTESAKIPTATVMMQCDVTSTMELVERLKARREFAGLRVSPLLIFAKAACLAMTRNPDVNSTLDDEAGEIVQHADVNLGIAAATPRGLVVPNVKSANRMNLLELAEALHNMVQVAKSGKVQPEDMARGTFTITNVGVFGVDGGTPILNTGESAIMCLGTIARRPWVIGKGADEQIVIRSVCTLSLTFDHRLVDGEIASTFLNHVAAILADPGLAMMF